MVKRIKCPHCNEPLTEEQIENAVVIGIKKKMSEMEGNKEHISNYSDYSILESILKALEDGQQ